MTLDFGCNVESKHKYHKERHDAPLAASKKAGLEVIADKIKYLYVRYMDLGLDRVQTLETWVR
jgi:hypothetical protein